MTTPVKYECIQGGECSGCTSACDQPATLVVGPCYLCEHVGPLEAPEGTVDTLVCTDWPACRARYLAKNPHVSWGV